MTWTSRDKFPADVFDACAAIDAQLGEGGRPAPAWALLETLCKRYGVNPVDVFQVYMCGSDKVRV